MANVPLDIVAFVNENEKRNQQMFTTWLELIYLVEQSQNHIKGHSILLHVTHLQKTQ